MNLTDKKYAQIIIPGLDQALTYAIPPELPEVSVGYEVVVDLRNRLERGWVIDLHSEAPSSNKEELKTNTNQKNLFSEQIQSRIKVKEIISGHKVFLEDDLKFFNLISHYYAVALSEVLENAAPRKTEERLEYFYTLATEHLDKSSEELESLLPASAKSQKSALLKLLECGGNLPASALKETPETKRALLALIKKGLITKDILTNEKKFPIIPAPNLTEQQKAALDKIIAGINQRKFLGYLLFGITGSGKTEVYIQAIEEAIKDGGSALIIVPEIALTPQLVSRFNSRLSHGVALLHSQIGSGAKWSEWQNILDGKKRIIIGARSAIFAPIKDLKIIIVDEEHESSYKQAEGLRYNARDLALIRGKERDCVVILGSATPSFESLANVAKKQLEILEITQRATNASLPEIKIVDLQTLTKSKFASPNITLPLFDAITKTLEKGEQVILFYNRRGFASFLQCTHCGKAVECSQCSVTMTYYQSKNRISCHYCGTNQQAPDACPKCSDSTTHEIDLEVAAKKIGKLSPRGSGTEKIFEEIQSLFPDAKVDRMDREVVGQKGSIENILTKMQTGETQILIGTQMLAKGHDLPSVTLVGIIDADVGLHFPDFRSSERTFQLIVQASGRAGRGSLAGKVIIQTREPNHPTIVAAITNRFKAFARYELDYRKKLNYPPESRLARVIISSPDKQETAEASTNLKEFLNNLAAHEKESDSAFTPWNTLGPSPAPIEKLRGRYRWHILIKSKSAKKLSQLAREIKSWKERTKYTLDLRVIVDIDPVDMM